MKKSPQFAFGQVTTVTQDVTAVQSELRHRHATDQEVRTNPAKSGDMGKVDKENTAWLKTVTGKWGWIDVNRFGVDAANTAFLIVQHSGDISLMTAALPEIEKDFKAKRLSDGQGYALLYDRLQLMLGHKQRYGSQVGMTNKGELTVLPLEDSARVDEYRKEMGMQPLAEYLTMLKKLYPDADASGPGIPKALLGLCGDLSLIGIAVPRLTANKYRAFRGIRAGIAFRSVASPWFSQVFHSKPLVFNGLRDVASFHPAENPPVNPEAPFRNAE